MTTTTTSPSQQILLNVVAPILTKEMSTAVLYYVEGGVKGTSIFDVLKVSTGPKSQLNWRDTVPAPPKSIPFTQDALTTQLRKKGISMVEPNEIIKFAKLGPVTAEDKLSFEFGGQQGQGSKKPFLDKIPQVLDSEFVLHSYTPIYKNNVADAGIIAAATSIMSIPTIPSAYKDAVSRSKSELLECMDNFYYGNGTIAGQLGRHSAVMDVFQRINATKVTDHKYEQWEKLMNRRFPLTKVNHELMAAPTEIFGSDMMLPPEERLLDHVQLTIERQSDAGPMWATGSAVVTREEVLPQDFDLATTIYKALNTSSPLVQAKQNAKGEILNTDEYSRAFWKHFGWMRTSRMKPKAEVYSRTELMTKTRNIFVTNSSAFLMAAMVLKAPHQKMPTVIDNDETWNMIGFSPYHGGMNKFVQKVIAKGSNFRCAYADNIYITATSEKGELCFVSMDGEKMEASIKRKDVMFEAYRSLKAFDKVSTPYVNYVEKVLPHISVGTYSLLGGDQIYVPYMASGVQGTAYYNTTKSILYLDALKQNPKIFLSGDKYVLVGSRACEENSGAIFKIERVTPLSTILNTGVLEEVQLDLLGFNAVECSTIFLPGRYIGVLDHDRLVKGMAFLKSDQLQGRRAKDDSGARNIIYTAIHFFRLRMFYFLGAWRDPGLSYILLRRCAELVQEAQGAFEHSDVAWDEELETMCASLNIEVTESLDQMTLIRLLTTGSIPSLYDVVKLHLGDSDADLCARKIYENWNTPYAYMPLEVYVRLGGDRGAVPDYIVAPKSGAIGESTFIPASIFERFETIEGKQPSWADYRYSDPAFKFAEDYELSAQDFKGAKPKEVKSFKPPQAGAKLNVWRTIARKDLNTLPRKQFFGLSNLITSVIKPTLEQAKIYHYVTKDNYEPYSISTHLGGLLGLPGGLFDQAVKLSGIEVKLIKVGEPPPEGYLRLREVFSDETLDHIANTRQFKTIYSELSRKPKRQKAKEV